MELNPPQEMIGAIKIKDGLFIGDKYSCQDLEFLITNKVTHIINCASDQLQNQWASLGILYLSLPWQETDAQALFMDGNLDKIQMFIDSCHQKQESTLIHSVRGQSRACCALASYFIRKYQWNLYKTLEFLNSRRPDLEIRTNFFQQLKQLETQLQNKMSYNLSGNWDNQNLQNKDEMIIRNTFLNGKNQTIDQMYLNKQQNQKILTKFVKQKIKWNNNHLSNKSSSYSQSSYAKKNILKNFQKSNSLNNKKSTKNSQIKYAKLMKNIGKNSSSSNILQDQNLSQQNVLNDKKQNLTQKTEQFSFQSESIDFKNDYKKYNNKENKVQKCNIRSNSTGELQNVDDIYKNNIQRNNYLKETQEDYSNPILKYKPQPQLQPNKTKSSAQNQSQKMINNSFLRNFTNINNNHTYNYTEQNAKTTSMRNDNSFQNNRSLNTNPIDLYKLSEIENELDEIQQQQYNRINQNHLNNTDINKKKMRKDSPMYSHNTKNSTQKNKDFIQMKNQPANKSNETKQQGERQSSSIYEQIIEKKRIKSSKNINDLIDSLMNRRTNSHVSLHETTKLQQTQQQEHEQQNKQQASKQTIYQTQY